MTPTTAAAVVTEEAAPVLVSPGLANRSEQGAAFELKFPLSSAALEGIEDWAREHLTPDTHGIGGAYRILSVYHDTPHLDVFHRSEGFRNSKYRLRRYDDSTQLFLERKTRRGDQVRKRRIEIPHHELPLLANPNLPDVWAGEWFHRRLQSRNLQPTCRVTYLRTAFFGRAGDGPVRLTIDRELMGAPTTTWDVSPLRDGTPLLPDGGLLELKFHIHVPPLFQDLIARLPGQLPRCSKYRRCVELSGLAANLPPASLPFPTGGAQAASVTG